MARASAFLAVLCIAVAAIASADGADARKMVGAYVLKKGDFSVKISNWGATIMSIVTPDSKGNLGDVVLGFDTLAEYVNDTSYFGPLTGRVAQRMARGRFVLDGKVYHTYINDGKNAIHGGHRGFSKVIWTVKEYVGGGDSPYITLYYRSFDGEQGNLQADPQNQCRPGVERVVDALRAEVGNLQADTTHRAEPVASIDMPPLLLSTDASSSSSKPASASRQISTDAAATSCIDHLDTSHVVPADAMLSAIVEEGLEPTADLRLGAEYDLDTSASTWTATASVATAVKASTASSATRSLACPISRTGISPFIPPSSCKDAQDVFESMSEPFGQSQDTTVTMKQQKDGQDSEVTLVVHPSNWYDQLLVSSVPCSVSMHIQIVFEKQRRVVTCELHSSWLLHAQANFSDWCSIGQLDIDDIVPIFPWNPGGYLSASINQMNLVFPATIRGSHWLVPSARDGPTGNSPFPVLGDEWLLPPWDFGQHADVSDDQFSWLMCELQLSQRGSHCLYLQEQQLYRNGIEEIVLNSLSININLCQLKWSASVLAYPGDMALYCSCFSSASEDISYESKMEHNNWVSCKVEQNTDASTYGIKTALHSLCISVTTFRKRNRSVVYALLILFQYTALKYKGLWWSPTATLTEIMSTFSVGFPVQMDVICSVQPFLYVEETLVHKVLSGLLSVDEHQLSAGLNANHPTPGVIPRFSIAYAELRLPFSGAAINSALAVSLEDDIVVAFLNWYAGFPGDLDVYATYQLSGPHELSIRTNATALNKATPVNFLQHVYWNLGGEGSGDILGHTLQLSASRYTPMDEELLPSSGRVDPVAGTSYDFRTPTPIGARIRKVTGGSVFGYDINYVIDGEGMRKVAAARDGASGRGLELWANQPAMQLYTGNFLNNTKGKDGKVYDQYGGFALETQAYPDAVNHPEFPSIIVRPGQVYKHDMLYKFSF